MTLFVFLVVMGLCWVLILAEVAIYTGDWTTVWKAPVTLVVRVLRARPRRYPFVATPRPTTRTVVPYRQEPVMPRQPWEKPDPSSLARDIALAEAAVGIDLPLDPTSPCPVCGKARLVGARYCSDCRYDWEPEAPVPHMLYCGICEKRIPDDARVCPYCGKSILAEERLWNREQTTVPSPVGHGAWRCSLCGAVFTWHAAPQTQERPRTCETCGAHYNWQPVPPFPPNPYPGNPKLREYDTSGADLVTTSAKPKRTRKGKALPTERVPAEPPAAQTGAAREYRGEWMRTPQGWVRDGYQPRTYTVHEPGRGEHTVTEGDNLFRHGHAARLDGGNQPRAITPQQPGESLAQLRARAGELRSAVSAPPGGDYVWDLHFNGGTLVTAGRCPHCNHRVTPDQNRALCPACKGTLVWLA